MTAAHILASSAGTNYTVVGVLLAIFVPIFGALAAILGFYFRLQRHRTTRWRWPPTASSPRRRWPTRASCATG